MAINELYSKKDLHGQNFTKEPAENFDGDIVGSNFEQLEPNTDVFPVDATGNLLRCNLLNCNIPVGMSVGATQGVDSINAHIAWQNDGDAWVVDKDTLVPIEPLRKAKYLELGISIDPNDIPESPLAEPLLITKIKEQGAS
jgi:hypothetical protein